MSQFSDSRKADRSTDPRSARKAIVARSQLRSGHHILLYSASVFFILQSMSALGVIDQIVYGGWYGKTGDKITQTLNLMSILASIFLVWSGTRGRKIAGFNRILPLMAPTLLLISVLWSGDPRLTLTQGTLYFFTVVGAIGLAEAWDSDALLDLIALICGLCAVASVVYSFIIFPGRGDFAGIFPQKNFLGQVMAVGVLAALHGLRIRAGRRLWYICIITLCTIVCFMSEATTAFMTIWLFFLLDMLGRLYVKGVFGRIISIFLASGCVLILVLLVMNQDLVFESLGKDPTLTGRTLFWPYVIDAIFRHPLLGWGFFGFWSPKNPFAWEIFAKMNAAGYTFVIANAHNGLLEFLIELGFIGTSLFIFLWMRNFIIAVKCLNGPAKQFGLSSMCLLVGILAIGASDVVLLAPQQIWTNLFFMMGFICETKLSLARAKERQGLTSSVARRSPLLGGLPPISRQPK